MIMAFARSRIGRSAVGWFFSTMSFSIPVRRLRETDTLIAFHHPKPNYTVHILIVPKKKLSELSQLSDRMTLNF